MEFKVVGIERKSGEYNGRPYDNTILHCSYAKDGIEDGFAVASVKVKTERIEAPIVVGDKVSFYYDQYGNVLQVNIL
ncbi:MAG: hypothetical protein IJY39_02515 [Clostridia bacterium]|nr:hypothetical protein [Clostridia bacterium]MBQ9785196.1 hypothetical protein [Clostridia bacterium]